MRKIIFILLILFSASILCAQNNRLVTTAYPAYVYEGSSFQISNLFHPNLLEPDSLSVYLVSSESLEMKDIKVNLADTCFVVGYTQTIYNGTYGYVYKINDLPKCIYEKPAVQIVYDIESVAADDIAIDFIYEFFYGDVKEVYSGIPELDAIEIESAVISFYKPTVSSGKMLELIAPAEFNVEIPEADEYNNILIDFWAKFKRTPGKFFNLIDPELQDTLYSLSINRFSYISFPYEVSQRGEEVFVSKNSWYYVSLYYDRLNRSMSLTVNGTPVYVTQNIDINESGFTLNFNTCSDTCEIFIDKLDVWNLSELDEAAYKNKHYENAALNDAVNLTHFNFNTIIDTAKSSNVDVFDSDAPIFSRAPELNVVRNSSYLSLEWSARDNVNADYFIVEKSEDGRKFYDLYSMQALGIEDQLYSYYDQKEEKNEVFYYRIKQINKDGSTVYSSQIKVGLTQKEMFTVDQNYPNPFNPNTTITLEVLHATEMELTVYDVTGKKITRLHSGYITEGVHTFTFEGGHLPSGIYLYEVKSPEYSIVQKMILTK